MLDMLCLFVGSCQVKVVYAVVCVRCVVSVCKYAVIAVRGVGLCVLWVGVCSLMFAKNT